MKLGIIIVNYKTVELTIECLESIAKEHALLDLNVIVVDNNSQDGSFEKLSFAVRSKGWRYWVSVKSSGYNGGFSYGNNIAIRAFFNSKDIPDYVYLINPDAYVTSKAILKLVDFMEKNSTVGIVGSRIVNLDGIAQHSSFQFHSWLTELNRGFSLGVLSKALRRWVKLQEIPENSVRTDWVSGASMMIRKSVLEKIGLFDEGYFMYFEETDFCLRASRVGFECWYFPESEVVHHEGKSSGITYSGMAKRMPSYWFNSRRRYFIKNFGIKEIFLADTLWLFGFALWRIRNVFQNKKDHNPPHLWVDTFMNSVYIKGVNITSETQDDTH